MYDHFLMSEIEIAADLKRERKFAESIKKYTEINEKYPNHPHVFKGMAKTLAADGYFDKALVFFQSAAILFNNIGDEDNTIHCVFHVEQLTDLKKMDIIHTILNLKIIYTQYQEVV